MSRNSLPAALVARLAKRGLVSGEKLKADEEEKPKVPEKLKPDLIREEEEVFAENYDDQQRLEATNNNTRNSAVDTVLSDSDSEADVHSQTSKRNKGHPGCPNKSNIYHICTPRCAELWGEGQREPDPAYMRRQAAMLEKYPLPAHWKDVYDPGSGRHYYWEVDSDSVSWFPPGHPKSEISLSAATLRESKASLRWPKSNGGSSHGSSDNDDDEDVKSVNGSEASDSSEESEEEAKQKRLKEERRRKQEAREKLLARGRTKKKENDLDPMDPASYSDIPRGGWSEGLSGGNEAKTGVDVTAAGPLFQMRPYPNPGAILRANQAARPKPPTVDKPTVNRP